MDSGFSPSGALDSFSYRLANFLVENPAWEAVLEMTLCGSSFLFSSPAVFSLTGAAMQPLLNGSPIAMHRAYAAKEGDILHTTFAQRGVRAYFAVAGGFGIDPVLDSRSTNLKAKIGGFFGRALKTKDFIPFRWTTNSLPDIETREFDSENGAFPLCAAYKPDAPLTLRVVQGSQASFFTQHGIDTFYHSVYTVQADSDRMGVRFEGEAVESVHGTDIVSDGIAEGAVQIPGSGKPIVLLKDRQTTGGYAKIGAVVTEDLWRLSQAPPGSAVRFERVSAMDAEKQYIKTEKNIQRLKQRFTDKDRKWNIQNCCLVM
jgi:biotin-dependent carboxylase-like uncharacterized protein